VCEDYILPAFSYTVNGVNETSGVQVYAQYDYLWYNLTGAADFVPTADSDFNLVYYYNGGEICSRKVAVSDAGMSTIYYMTPGSGNTAYAALSYTGYYGNWQSAQTLFNTQTTVVFNWNPVAAGACVPLEFAVRGGSQDWNANFSWENGLKLQLMFDGANTRFYLGAGDYFDGGGAYAFSSSLDGWDWTASHTLTYSAVDVLDPFGSFLGISVRAWIDGADMFQSYWGAGAWTSGASLEADAQSSYVFIPASTVNADVSGAFNPGIFFMWERSMTDTITAGNVLSVAFSQVGPEILS